MITTGKSHHLAVDIILTVSEIDEIVRWYGKGNTEYDKKLLDKLEVCAKAIRFSGVRRIGFVDDTRLNWD